MFLLRYLSSLTAARAVLWCYFIWWVVIVTGRFDAAPRLWLTSLGISGIVGIALLLSTRSATTRLDGWQVFRLFLMPFCVSSFSALVKDAGFVLIFPPTLREDTVGLGCILGFLLCLGLVKRMKSC